MHYERVFVDGLLVLEIITMLRKVQKLDVTSSHDTWGGGAVMFGT